MGVVRPEMVDVSPAEPINPYVVGNAVYDDTKFFGRLDIIDWAVKALRSTHNNALVLFGQRRIGKTSLLRRLQHLLPVDGHRPVYFDLQDEGRRPLGEVLADLAEEIADQLDEEVPDPKNFDDRGKFFTRAFLPQIIKGLDSRSRLVLLIDEFEAVSAVADMDLPANSAAIALQPFLRKLMESEPRLAFVFALGRSADELTSNIKSIFKASQQRKLWVLDERSNLNLVRQAESIGNLHFTDDGIERILNLTSRHPYLTQLLCSSIWELSYEGVETAVGLPPHVSAQVVNFAVERALEIGGGAMEWVWDGLAPAEKIYAAALARIARENRANSADRVMATITEHAPRRSNAEVLRASADLMARGILREMQDEHFIFEFELFRKWVEGEKPLRVVEDELDLLKPEAEDHFLLGRKILRKKEKDSQDAREQQRHACDCFRRALEINPEHFKAQLALGETLLELGARRRALEALEAAHALNAKGARLIFVHALVQNAEVAHSGGDEDLALRLASRAAELSSENPTAQRIRSDIWVARGDRAQDEEEKIRWYYRARKTEKIREIETQRFLRAQQFEQITDVMRKIVASAESAAINCQQAAQTANELRRRSIWNAASTILWQERQMLLNLAKGIDGLKRKKWPWVETHFEAVKALLPEDESKGDRETSKDIRGHLPSYEVRRGAQYRIHEQAALAQVQTLIEVLMKGRSEAETLAPNETQEDALELWRHAIDKFQEKRATAQSYLEGIKALQGNSPNDAQRKLGWRLEPPPIQKNLGEDSEVLLAHGEQRANQTDSAPVTAEVLTPSSRTESIGQESLSGRIIALDFSPDGLWLASACSKWIKFWSPENHDLAQKLETRQKVKGISFSSDSTMLAVFFDDEIVRLWSIDEKSVIHKLKHWNTVTSVAFSPVGRVLAMGSQNGLITFLDLDKQESSAVQIKNEDPVHGLTFSPDGELLACGSSDAEVRLWRVADGSCVRSFTGAGGAVDDVAFSPDGSALAAAFADSIVRLWEIDSGECRYELLGHSGPVRSVAFHCEGYLLASGSLDGTVRLWRLADGELLETIEEPDAGVTAVRFSPDGQLLAWGTSAEHTRIKKTTGEDPPVDLAG